MAVFVSHAHYDHFGKEIFRLRDYFSEICFVLSSDIEAPADEDIISIGPNEEADVFGMNVRTLRSNDQGVAYLIHCGGRTICGRSELVALGRGIRGIQQDDPPHLSVRDQ